LRARSFTSTVCHPGAGRGLEAQEVTALDLGQGLKEDALETLAGSSFGGRSRRVPPEGGRFAVSGR
jgi:hypothetical protein